MSDPSSLTALNVSFVGDVYVPVVANAGAFNPFSKNFYDPLRDCDLIVANFEAPIALDFSRPREDKLYNLHHRPESLDLFDNRFVLGLANNHIMDFGETGLRLTLESLEERGISFAGAGYNLEQASCPVYRDCRGTRVAFISAADPRFQSAGRDRAGTMPAEIGLLDDVLQNAGQTADRVVVSIHAGMEFTRVPTPFMQRLAKLCAERGVSAVAFHHAHCISGHTRLDATDVFWGLGNYCFPKVLPVRFRPWFDSVAVHVKWDAELPKRTIDICPVRLDSSGLPSEATGESAHRILSIWDCCSRRIAKGRVFRLWRLASMLRLSYLRLSWVNYLAMIRQVGMGSFLRFLFSTAKLYLKGGRG